MAPECPRASNAFKGTDLGDEFVFYDRETHSVHWLNSSAREVYLLCDGRRTRSQIAEAFAEQQDVDAPTAVRDAQEMIDRLQALGLIVPS